MRQSSRHEKAGHLELKLYDRRERQADARLMLSPRCGLAMASLEISQHLPSHLTSTVLADDMVERIFLGLNLEKLKRGK
jgi:hypothetical protein